MEETPLDKIEKLHERLMRRELDLVPDLLAHTTDEEMASKATCVGRLAASPYIVRRSWQLIVTLGPNELLSSLLRDLTRNQPFLEALAAEKADQLRVRTWLEAKSIPEGMLRDLESAERPLVGWTASLPHLSTGVDRDTPLWRLLVHEMLRNGSGQLFRRHPAHDLQAWVSASPSAVQDEFCIQYLVELRAGRTWDPDLGDWIAIRMGEPLFDEPAGQWRRLENRSPGCTKDFANWRALRRLESFFDSIRDPHARFAFWRDGFARHIVDVREVADGAAALLYLPPLVVAEFADTGFAAYAYPGSEWHRLRSLRARNPRDYQQRDRLVPDPVDSTPYKINHFDGWQDKAGPKIRMLLARSPN